LRPTNIKTGWITKRDLEKFQRG